MKVVITRKLPGDAEQMIRNASHDVWIHEDDCVIPRDLLLSKVQDADALITLLTDKVDTDLLKNAPNLKIVANYAVGFDNIDVKACCEHDVICTNTPDVLTDATAEIAILVLLGAARRAKEGIEWANKKNWKWSADFLMGKQLTGSRLGILGMGRIGGAVADRARSFGMKIHYFNRSRLKKNLEKDAVYHKSLESLLSVSDFLSINCPATKETKHIINEKTIKNFPDGAVISNSARGDMIDDEAMVKALKSGKIFSLGLDVYNGEPNIHPEYLALPNVFVLPHLGSSTIKTRVAMGDLAVSNIIEFFKTGKCKNKIN